MAIVRYGVLNDVHMPFEGRCYGRALQIMATWGNLAGIYFNGDGLEISGLSTHPKDPSIEIGYRKEIDYANQKFDEIESMFQGVPVEYIEGNHEYRFLRYIRDVAPQLWGLVEQPHLLKFHERGWRFHEYGPTQWVKCGDADLWLRHEPLQMGVNCAKGTAEKSLVNVLFGHTHQKQEYTNKKHGPRPRIVTAYSGGYLGDINNRCFDYRGSKDNWVEGFNEIECDTESGEYAYRFHKTGDVK